MTVARTNALPTDSAHDAAPSDAHAGEMKPAEMAVGVVIGRTSESFDFLVYAIASVLVFPKHVFPYTDELTATLYSLAIFCWRSWRVRSAPHSSRPSNEAYGRGTKLCAALLLLGTSTVAIGFLPGYAEIGMASVWLLALLRVSQGMALGGSWDGLPSIAGDECASTSTRLLRDDSTARCATRCDRRERLVCIQPREPLRRGLPRLGLALSVFRRIRDQRGGVVCTPAYRRRAGICTTFHDAGIAAVSILETVRSNGRTIVIGAFVPLAGFALFHIVTVFPLSWVFLFAPEGATRFLIIQAIGSVFGIVASIASGWLADRLGRRRSFAISAAAIAGFGGFAPGLLNAGAVGEVAFVLVGFALSGCRSGRPPARLPRISRQGSATPARHSRRICPGYSARGSHHGSRWHGE